MTVCAVAHGILRYQAVMVGAGLATRSGTSWAGCSPDDNMYQDQKHHTVERFTGGFLALPKNTPNDLRALERFHRRRPHLTSGPEDHPSPLQQGTSYAVAQRRYG
ncbi:hypothetical protein Bbelb_145660 [Branchiostoma belcheri]|nr:hypothetical protein Bbelb_145660 [Branchiostoma belcheri]